MLELVNWEAPVIKGLFFLSYSDTTVSNALAPHLSPRAADCPKDF